MSHPTVIKIWNDGDYFFTYNDKELMQIVSWNPPGGRDTSFTAKYINHKYNNIVYTFERRQLDEYCRYASEEEAMRWLLEQ